ncbi:MAG: PTS system trehalose-specific EIIBC component [Erysipelotrichaceae bacterium]|nr:PTS system trehalose-specific EIIBC component [Erysipelotrichaceae bacterium]
MGKFTEDATKLLELVGGKENINAITHCVTRMRFVLADPSKANIKKIESLSSVKGTFTQAGQFQVIIGNEVADFYKEFTSIAGIEGVSKDAAKNAAKDNQTPLQKIMSNIAEIFAPLIPAIICGGLILGFRNILETAVVLQDGTFLAGLDKFLWIIGEAVFHTGIPVGICWSVQRKMGGTPMLGIVLGLTLISGQLVNAYGVPGMAADAWAPNYVWNFGFASFRMIGYQAQVIPAILAAFTLTYLERFFKKIVPQVLQMILVPFCSLLLAVMAAHFILGPIGWKVGEWVSAFVMAGISGNFRVLFGAIFGFFYAPLVITGLHHMSNAIDLQLINSTGGTMLWPMIALSNIAQGAAVAGMSYLQKNNVKAQEVNIPSMISCWLGVTEPAMFGINLKYQWPFYCAMTGSCLAAVISTLFSVTAASIGVGGLPGIISIFPKYMLIFAFAMLVALVVPFVLTVMIGKAKINPATGDLYENDAEEEEPVKAASYTNEQINEAFAAPVKGRVMPVTEVEDQVFASKAMGDGIAIDPAEGKIYAPFSGEITVVFPTGHAYGLKAANGKEVLIHIGMDTVELNGKGFTPHVKQGDIVKQGDLLSDVDLDYIRSQGKPVITPVIFTDGTPVEVLKTGDVAACEKGIIKLG